MAVKRHAICGNLRSKVRHIYDVTKLFQLEEIKDFLSNKDELKRLIKLTKETDSIYSFYRRLIELRKEKKVISEGSIEFLERVS